MPPFLSTARRWLGWGALAALPLAPRLGLAQANNGALDLVAPIGAHATGMGTAFVAEEGSESIWWNPAGMARLDHSAFAIDHSENFFVKDDGISLIAAINRLGAAGITARYFNYGAQPAVDIVGNETGELLTRSIALGASFATTFGPRVNGGVTYRLYQSRIDCSGLCEGQETGSSTTSAVDVGVQFSPLPGRPLRIGAEVRNLGLSLQVKDKPQADALPTRLHVGAAFDPRFEGMVPELTLRTTAEIVSAPDLGNAEVHVGGQVGYKTGSTTLIARGGYVWQQGGGISSGPALGLGLASRRVQLDLARIFEDFSSTLGKPPTYISIRVGL
jgi:hypothetical protein